MNDEPEREAELLAEIEQLRARVAELEDSRTRLIQETEPVRRSEEKYRSIVESIQEGYYEVDLKGNVAFFNESLCKILGCSGTDLRGRNYRELMTVSDAEEVFRAYNEVYRTGVPKGQFDYRLVGGDGIRRIVQISVALMRDSDGSPAGFRGIFRDVTDSRSAEKALQFEKERFETLAEQAPLGIMMVGPDGSIEYINRAFTRMFGYEITEIPRGRDWFRVASPDTDSRRRMIASWVQYESGSMPGPSTPFVYTIRCKDGTEKVIHFRAARLDAGDHIVTCEDITELERAEASLSAELRKFQVLYDLATALTADESLDTKLSLVVDKTRELLKADAAFMALRHEEAGEVHICTISGIRTAAFKGLKIPIGVGLGGSVAKTGMAVLVEDYCREVDSPWHGLIREEGLKSGVAAPIQMGQTNLGVIYAANRSEAMFTQSDLETLTLLGNVVAVELTRTDAESEVRKARDLLDIRVQQRTAELADANQALAEENADRVRAEQGMRDSEELLTNILNASPIGIGYHGGGRIKWLNHAMIQMFGYGGYEGQHPRDSYASDDEYKRVKALFFQNLRKGRLTATEALFKRQNGSTFSGLLRLSPLDPADPSKGYIATVVDLTDRKLAEQERLESEERYRTLVEQGFDGIMIHDGKVITFGNSRLHEMLGYAPGDLKGLRYWRVFHPSSQQLVQSRAAARLRGEMPPPEYEVTLQRKDGTSFHGEINARAIRLGGESYLQAWIRDISERKRTEKELNESRQMLTTVLSASPIGIARSEERKVVWANEAFVRMFRFSDETEFLGQDGLMLYASEEDYARVGTARYEKLTLGLPATIDVTFRRKDGTTFAGNITLGTTDPSDPAKDVIAAIIDISERKRAEEALRESEEKFRRLYEQSRRMEELYHSLLDSTPDAIVTYDLEGRTTYVNGAFIRMFGWQLDELAAGVPYVPHSEEEVTRRNVMGVVREGLSLTHFETRRRTKDGDILDVSISASRFNDHEGNPAGMLVLLRNISAQKRAEKELQQALETAKQLRTQAEDASRAKSEFVANMSHEIRTPLHAITGLTDLALRSDLSPKVRDYVTKVYSSSQVLLGIINDILDFSKIEAGKLDLEMVDFDLRDVMDRLTDLLGDVAVKKDVEFLVAIAPDVPCVLHGDPLRLAQVLANLTSNAVKFTHRGEIVVRARLLSRETDSALIEFSVKDTGIGFEPEKIRWLFEPFTQADGSMTRKYGGSGLGLTICKRLVQIMGGRITGESRPGEGSRFSFALSFRIASEERQESERCFVPRSTSRKGRIAAREAYGPSSLEGARVLVAEDNEINQQVAKEILEAAGVIVEIVGNGMDAVRAVGEARFDVVLMDVQMPELDGYEATRAIRADPCNVDLAIIAMTAHAMKGDREKCLESGMNDHVSKPIDVSEFLATLAAWIEPRSHAASDRVVQPVEAPAMPDPLFPESLPGINLQRGLELLGGDTGILTKLLMSFAAYNTDAPARIRDAWRRGDGKEAERLAHSLKGVAGNLGVDHVHITAMELEMSIRESRNQDLERLFSQLDREVKVAVESIDRLTHYCPKGE